MAVSTRAKTPKSYRRRCDSRMAVGDSGSPAFNNMFLSTRLRRHELRRKIGCIEHRIRWVDAVGALELRLLRGYAGQQRHNGIRDVIARAVIQTGDGARKIVDTVRLAALGH